MRNSQRYLLGKTLIQLAINDPLDSTLDIEAEERRFIEDNWELEISLWTFHFSFFIFFKIIFERWRGIWRDWRSL